MGDVEVGLMKLFSCAFGRRFRSCDCRLTERHAKVHAIDWRVATNQMWKRHSTCPLVEADNEAKLVDFEAPDCKSLQWTLASGLELNPCNWIHKCEYPRKLAIHDGLLGTKCCLIR